MGLWNRDTRAHLYAAKDPQMSGDQSYERAKASILSSLNGTQAQIAKQVGVSQSMVGRWLKGNRTPSPEQLSRLAKLAGGELVIEFKPKKRAKQ